MNAKQITDARNTYPWIVRWGQTMDSYDYYIDNQVLEAMKDKAPFEAIFKEANDRWVCISDCSPETQKTLGYAAKPSSEPIETPMPTHVTFPGGKPMLVMNVTTFSGVKHYGVIFEMLPEYHHGCVHESIGWIPATMVKECKS